MNEQEFLKVLDDFLDDAARNGIENTAQSFARLVFARSEYKQQNEEPEYEMWGDDELGL